MANDWMNVPAGGESDWMTPPEEEKNKASWMEVAEPESGSVLKRLGVKAALSILNPALPERDEYSELRAAQKAYEQKVGFLDRMAGSAKRGYYSALANEHLADASKLAELISAGKGSQADFDAFIANISNAAKYNKIIRAIPASPVIKTLGDEDISANKAIQVAVENPLATITEEGPSSLVQSAPMMAAAITAGRAGLGKPGAVAAAGAGSAAVDYPAELASALGDYGVDLTNVKQVSEALRDPEILADIKKKAGLHAAFVGLLDAVATGVASKVLAPAAVKGKIAKEVINVPAQIAVQGLTGGGGEALGQAAAYGRVKPGEVVLEAAAEAFGAPADVVSLAVAGARDSRAKAKATDAWMDIPPGPSDQSPPAMPPVPLSAPPEAKQHEIRQAAPVPEPTQYTLRALDLIPGSRDEVKVQSVLDTLNRQDVKGAERQLVTQVLEENFKDQPTISRQELQSRVAEKLPALGYVDTRAWADVGLDNLFSPELQRLNLSTWDALLGLRPAAMDRGIALHDLGILAKYLDLVEIRQALKVLQSAQTPQLSLHEQNTLNHAYNTASEILPFKAARTTIYNLPWATGGDTHFKGFPNQAVHTRSFYNTPTKTRSVVEVQSGAAQRRKTLGEEDRLALQQTLASSIKALTAAENELADVISEERRFVLLEKAENTRRYIAELKNKLADAEPIPGIGEHLYALALRLENQRAARAGEQTMRFATPETVAKVEGWDKLEHKTAKARGIPGLMRRYERLGKLVQKEFGAKLITDDRGNTWFEWAVQPEAATKAVQYYNERTTGNPTAGATFKDTASVINFVDNLTPDISLDVWDATQAMVVRALVHSTYRADLAQQPKQSTRVLGFVGDETWAVEIAAKVEAWRKRFLPGVTITITDFNLQDAMRKHGQPYGIDGQSRDADGGMFMLTPDHAVITLNEEHGLLIQGESGNLTYRQWDEIISHEFGHVIAMTEFTRAPQEIRAAVLADLRAIQQQAVRGTVREAYAMRESPMLFISQLGALDGTNLDMPMAEFLRTLSPEEVEYIFSYHELLATQYAKHTARVSPQVGAQRLYNRIHTVLKRFFEYVKAEWFSPAPSYDKFLQHIVEQKAGIRPRAERIATTRLRAAFKESKVIRQSVDQLQASKDRYSWWLRQTDTLIDLANRNPHIEPLQRYLEHVRRWAAARAKWMARADGRVHEWFGLGKDQSNRLAKMLLDETISEKAFDLQNPASYAKYGLKKDALELYLRIKEDFALVLDVIEDTLIKDAQRRLTQDPVALATRVDEIRKDFNDMRAKPYFPLPRFGNYSVVARAMAPLTYRGAKYRAGAKIEVQLHESREAAASAADALRKELGPNANVGTDKIPEQVFAFVGMPQRVLENLGEVLRLDETQMKALRQYQHDIAPGQSWRKHLMHRQSIAGFSEDALRGYSAYMFHAANHIARISHYRDLAQATQDLHTTATRLQKAGLDAVTRRQIAEHLDRHMNYILNPQNEWEALRSFAFGFYLSFVPRAAVMNLFQVPMVTGPYLTKRFGTVDATAEMVKALDTMTELWFAPGKVAPSIVRMVEEGKAGGWLDESLAQELAGITTGNALERYLPQSEAGRRIRQFARVGSWMFHQAEKINRLGTAIATYNLATKQGKGHTDAVLEARRAVETTHFEYSKWARPEAFRGKIKGNVLVFKRYVLGMLKFLRNDPGSIRALAMMLVLAGLTGLPFAEDLLDLANWLGRRIKGTRFDAEVELGKMIKDMGGNPELMLHGTSRYFGPFDMSRNLSLGDIVPYTKALSTPGTFEQKLPDMIGETGALFNIPLQIMQAASSNNPDTMRRLEPVMPVWARDIAKAARYAEAGAAQSPRGETLMRLDPSDPLAYWSIVLGQAAGLTPREVSRAYEKREFIRNAVEYYRLEREALLNAWAMAAFNNDREAMADTKKAITDYNQRVRQVDPKMYISGKSMANARINRKKQNILREKDLPPDLSQYNIYKDAAEAFPKEETVR